MTNGKDIGQDNNFVFLPEYIRKYPEIKIFVFYELEEGSQWFIPFETQDELEKWEQSLRDIEPFDDYSILHIELVETKEISEVIV